MNGKYSFEKDTIKLNKKLNLSYCTLFLQCAAHIWNVNITRPINKNFDYLNKQD